MLALKCPVRHDARSPRHILCSAVHLRAHTPHHYKASLGQRNLRSASVASLLKQQRLGALLYHMLSVSTSFSTLDV